VAFTSVDTLTTAAVALPAGSNKVVEIWEGAQLDTSGGLDGTGVKGVYAYAVRGVFTLDSPLSPTRKAAVYGDSIACSYYATIPVRDGWFPQARLAMQAAGGRLALDGWGGRSMGREPDVDALAARLVAAVAGVPTRQIVLFIGTNDFGLGTARATFRANYGALLDGIRSRDTGASVYCVKPLPRTDQATPNGAGAVLADYAADIATVQSTRTWATLADASGWINTGTDVVGDGIHPNDAGHGKVLTQVRALVGF
jgi:lysophospholipase L1-like esterase